MKRFDRNRRNRHPRGTILLLTAFLMIALLGMVAFAVDLGYLMVVRNELQRTADSSAMAAAWRMLDSDAREASPPEEWMPKVRLAASQYALLNAVASLQPELDENAANAPDGDVVIGYLADPFDANSQMTFDEPERFNAVRIRVRRTSDVNGEVPLHFARLLRRDGTALQAVATAAVVSDFVGFQTPHDGTNLPILPLALDEYTWDQVQAGIGQDTWSYDPDSGVVGTSDGFLEMNLFPQGTGAPGNRGTVNIGTSNNSTKFLHNQISNGVTQTHLDFHGGSLRLDENGNLYLSGNTGISAGIEDAMKGIIGQKRVIPVFRDVYGPGNNASFRVVKFVGVRILDVDLRGSMSNKRVIVQPTNIVIKGGIFDPGAQTTDYIHSPVVLVR
jgi:Flp pilus assembly protein TadG